MYVSLMLHAKNETLRSLECANQAIDIYHKIYGTDHRELIQLYYLKGRILQRRLQIEQSVESYQETLRIRSSILESTNLKF
jgi:tetratricopeptide (TPR) repeat protein